MAYTRGEFLRIEFTCDARPDSVRLIFSSPQGTYKPWWSALKIESLGIESGPRSVSVDVANTSNWKFDPSAHTVMLTVPASPSTHEIVGSWKLRTADDPTGRCQPNLLNSGVFSIILNHCDLP
jgi:hypothetical protein